MASTDHDQLRIRDYLLGHLSDEEQQKIEERLMIEDELFDELEVSKGELIEEYCANELGQSERQWFKENYLSSDEGRQRHAFTLALDSCKRSTPAPQPVSWFERLRALLKSPPWIISIATSTALVAIVAGLVFYRPTTQYTSPTSYAFTLHSTLGRRSTGEAYTKVPLNPEVGALRITLQLPEGITPGNSYRMELDDRREITNLKETSHDAGSVLAVIPTASLREGIYSLRLYAIKADGTEQIVPGEYRFELALPPSSTSKPPQTANQQ